MRCKIAVTLLLAAVYFAMNIESLSTGDEDLPSITHSGYLDVNKHDGSQIFYTYYEPQEPHSTAPILLWLQVYPGTLLLY